MEGKMIVSFCHKNIKTNIESWNKKRSRHKIHIFNETYSQFLVVSYLRDGISHYANNLNEGEWMFINCDMYDDFLKFKISIKRKNNKIYLYKIKHILSK